MTHDKDKILLRAKDISLLVMVVTFLGLIAGPLKKIFVLDSMIEKVEKLEDKTYSHATAIAVVMSQNKEILEQIKQLNWQMRNFNRSSRRMSDGE